MRTKNDIIEEYILKHRSDFDTDNINIHHEEKFLMKLSRRFKKLINIVPYLLRVFIVTIIVFIVSIWAWNSYIRKDRNEIALKEKILNIVTFKN